MKPMKPNEAPVAMRTEGWDTPSDEAAFLAVGRPVFEGSAPSADLRAAWARALDTRDLAGALARVDGDFAVGMRLADGRQVLAVDRFAERSLCYRISEGRLQFAEQADALADAGTPIDPQAIYDYLYFHVIPSPRTIFEGILRLPAAHYAVFDRGQLTVQPYWVPAFDEPASASFDAMRERFLAALESAVSRQLDGSKAACFLSGGTDSSTVAGMIGRVRGEPADCYSIGFEAEGYDEMAYARLAARHFKCRHHEYYVTPDDLVRSIGDLAARMDQPFGNSSVLPAYYCAKVAREDGVTHMLAGDGGDELYGGNSRYAKQRIFSWYDQVPGALQRGLLEPMLSTALAQRIPVVKKAASYVEQARVPMPDRLQMYNLLQRLGIDTILEPGLLSRLDLDGPLRHQRAVWSQAKAGALINRMLAFDWRYTLAESDLPKVRTATAAAGVTVGYPMLDRALLDLSLGLPPEYKLKGLKLRWFFKEALRGFLPDEIITKKKQGFGLPFGVWSLRHAGLNRLATDSLRSLAERGIVQPKFIDTLLTSLLPAHPGYYGELVWILMMLEQWVRTHRPALRFAG